MNQWWIKYFVPVFIALIMSTIAANNSLAIDDASDNDSIVLRIGKVSSQPRKHYPRFQNMASFLMTHLKEKGVSEIEVLFAKDNEEMIQFLKEEKIDIVSETMFSAILYQEMADVDILLREWRNNVPEYHTVFFTRKDSGITSLSDLRGKILAFEDPGSTSAYFLPTAVLYANNIRMHQIGWPGQQQHYWKPGDIRHQRRGTPCLRRRRRHRRHAAFARRRRGHRPDGHRLLRPRPLARDRARRRHPPHAQPHDHAGADEPLSDT